MMTITFHTKNHTEAKSSLSSYLEKKIKGLTPNNPEAVEERAVAF